MASTWISYNELAWTEEWLASPSDYEKESQACIELINSTAPEQPQTMLHLGSGAGGHDYYFKRHLTVTGVDLSQGMLNRARKLHPDIEYIEGDMRTLRLNRQFDVVVIPDSIDYMTAPDDLLQAIQTAVVHLKRGGVLLVMAKTEETFQNNNFVYTGEKEDVHVTLFENNYINPARPNTYEATFIYLIRQQGELAIHTENQVLGLFPRETWQKLFRDNNLTMQETNLHGVYDRYLLGDGEYPLTVFVGLKE
jgi:ubiquinone/menaquinone biosynthesis C-methylase UbiE